MEPGDIVRFKLPCYLNMLSRKDPARNNSLTTAEEIAIGLLVSYESMMRVVDVLYEGKVVKIIAQHVEKAEKKIGFD